MEIGVAVLKDMYICIELLLCSLSPPPPRGGTATKTGDGGMEVRSSSGKEPRAVRLPGDLVAEILARVPNRSLCRFKLVSRSWRALCSDPAVRRRCAPRPWPASSYAPCPSAPPLGTSATSSMCRGEVRPWSTPPSRSCQPATGTRACAS